MNTDTNIINNTGFLETDNIGNAGISCCVELNAKEKKEMKEQSFFFNLSKIKRKIKSRKK